MTMKLATKRSILATQIAFTLVEVMVSLAIFGLITVSLYEVFHLSHRAREKAQSRSEVSVTLSGMQDLLGTYIRSAYPYTNPVPAAANLPPNQIGVLFSGEDERMTFVTSAPRATGGRYGLAKITLSWQGDEKNPGPLIIQEQVPVRFDDRDDAPGIVNRLVAMEGVRTFKIEYLDPQTIDEETWEEYWDRGRGALPRAVRFILRGPKGQEIQWVFPIMIQVMTPR